MHTEKMTKIGFGEIKDLFAILKVAVDNINKYGVPHVSEPKPQFILKEKKVSYCT